MIPIGISRQLRRDKVVKLAAKASAGVHYRLYVAHDVRRTDLPTFYQSGQALVNLIEGVGLKLLMSCWTAVDNIVRIYNYWDLNGDANALLDAELRLPDEPLYVKFDELMLSEQKDLVVPMVPDVVPLPKPANERLVYFRVTYAVPSSDLAEFAARLEASLASFAKANSWGLGASYLGLTGQAGAVSQMWAIPEHAASLAQLRIMTTTWQSLLAEAPVCQILEPTPSDPLLGLYLKPVFKLLP